MERAIRHLLDTPDPPASARVQSGRGTNYVYSDPALESLSAAQRQLMRLGPARTARVKEKLRAFGDALGIPRVREGRPSRPSLSVVDSGAVGHLRATRFGAQGHRALPAWCSSFCVLRSAFVLYSELSVRW